jgi:hypothetical protein
MSADPRATLERALETEGLSLRAMAHVLMGRDARTLWRWRSGETPIPPLALAWIQWFAGLSAQDRRTLRNRDQLAAKRSAYRVSLLTFGGPMQPIIVQVGNVEAAIAYGVPVECG